MFIRISLPNPEVVSIGIYSNETRELIQPCMDNSYDSCYVPAEKLKPDSAYAILVMSEVNIERYVLYTHWGDVEHLKGDQEIKFMFQKDNTTQLFHYEINKDQEFEELRIILKP